MNLSWLNWNDLFILCVCCSEMVSGVTINQSELCKDVMTVMNIPSTQLVEKKAMLRVSRGLSWVQSGDRVCGSDSPVREELSTWTQKEKTLRLVCYEKRFIKFCEFWAHLAAVGGDDTEVGGDPVSTFHLHQVSRHHLLSVDLHLLSLPDHQGLLGSV